MYLVHKNTREMMANLEIVAKLLIFCRLVIAFDSVLYGIRLGINTQKIVDDILDRECQENKSLEPPDLIPSHSENDSQ